MKRVCLINDAFPSGCMDGIDDHRSMFKSLGGWGVYIYTHIWLEICKLGDWANKYGLVVNKNIYPIGKWRLLESN